MRNQQAARLRSLEGRHVSVALRDGGRIDDSQLLSAGHHDVHTVWLFSNGVDLFVPLADVVDVWEVQPLVRSRAA